MAHDMNSHDRFPLSGDGTWDSGRPLHIGVKTKLISFYLRPRPALINTTKLKSIRALKT